MFGDQEICVAIYTGNEKGLLCDLDRLIDRMFGYGLYIGTLILFQHFFLNLSVFKSSVQHPLQLLHMSVSTYEVKPILRSPEEKELV